MKRRLFFRSVCAAFASVALAQIIAREKFESLLDKPLLGWQLFVRAACGASTTFKWNDGGLYRRCFQVDEWWVVERWDGTVDRIAKIPAPSLGEFQFVYYHGDGGHAEGLGFGPYEYSKHLGDNSPAQVWGVPEGADTFGAIVADWADRPERLRLREEPRGGMINLASDTRGQGSSNWTQALIEEEHRLLA